MQQALQLDPAKGSEGRCVLWRTIVLTFTAHVLEEYRDWPQQSQHTFYSYANSSHGFHNLHHKDALGTPFSSCLQRTDTPDRAH